MDCFSLSCIRTRNCRNRSRLVSMYRYEDLMVATRNFSQDRLLGRGSYGSVYKAYLNGRFLAVKRLRSSNPNPWSNPELNILSKIECSHVVNLIGFCQRPEQLLLVVEYMENGTLYDALHSETVLSWPLRIKFAYQIAKAVAVLHGSSPQIIHRDIKSTNVLIDRKWNARLGDLGLALQGNKEDIQCTPAGTTGYIDPRYNRADRVGPKIDVYSFGVLLLEIITGAQPVHADANNNMTCMVDWVLPLIRAGKYLTICDRRVKLPSRTNCIRRMVVVAARCIRSKTAKRPTMDDVVRELAAIKSGRPLSDSKRNTSSVSSSSVSNVSKPPTAGLAKETRQIFPLPPRPPRMHPPPIVPVHQRFSL